MEKTDTYKNISKELAELTEKALYCMECGKCTGSCPMVELFPGHFHPHHLLSELYQAPEKVLHNPAIWLCASCYRCNPRCPQGIEIPGIIVSLRKIAKKENKLDGLEKALKMISEKIPFPASFFSVCLHPERIPLNNNIVEKLLDNSYIKEKENKVSGSKEKVAVVGSGPAGLMAAYELSKTGYKVTVFESAKYAGGMFSLAIPEYRLPMKVIQKEIKNLQSFGIEFKTNTQAGKDISLNQLSKKGYKAVFLAIGAHKCKQLKIEGEKLNGIYDTLEFLRELKIGKRKINANNVVVIGGGNTALDAASAAINIGADNVSVLYRRTKEDMPADINELREAEAEGIKFRFMAGPVKYIGDKKHVKQVECIEMEMGPKDLSGRRSPLPVKNSNFVMDADLVVVAIGEEPDSDFLPKKIDLLDGGRISINPFTMETNMSGVFAGGDGVLGPATIAEAILAARKAVVGIDKYIKNDK